MSIGLLFVPVAQSEDFCERPVVVLGDSLSAAYGILPEDGWVSLLAKKITMPTVNASVSGETTAGAIITLKRVLEHHNPSVVVVEVGGNDGLRGLPLTHIETNIERIITTAEAHGSEVLLLGMRLPPNYGQSYTDQFEIIFSRLARRYELMFVPFFLDNVALQPELMQEDGMHPNAAAQPHMLNSVFDVLSIFLEKRCG